MKKTQTLNELIASRSDDSQKRIIELSENILLEVKLKNELTVDTFTVNEFLTYI